MFLCDDCHNAGAHLAIYSRGACEGCGKMTACIDCHNQNCGPDTPLVNVEEAREEITRAIARMIYERVTRKDWRTAERDPGFDPAWRQHAEPIAGQAKPGGTTVH